jgi:hypothetical protein
MTPKTVPDTFYLAAVAIATIGIVGDSCCALPPGTLKTDADARCEAVLRLQLAKPYPPNGCWRHQDFALAAYWLNERTTEADRAILAEHAKEFPESLKKGDGHWNAYILERIYFLFGHASKHFPGRMSAAAEAALLDMLWQWAGPRCRLEMTLPSRDGWRWGSENHHAQAWSGFWGAAQIFAQHTDYKNRRYADGTTPAQMVVAFNEYYKRFARNTAAAGLLVECNSAYNKYTLGGWYNMADFADDRELRHRMAMLLDLYWADWAIEEIDGVRGGSRHRCYPGANSTSGTSMEGLAWYHFGLGSANSQHPGHMCGATTFWRPSPLVVELARDAAGRGVYEYISRRPGLAATRKTEVPPPNFVTESKHPFFERQGVYALRPEGGGLLRYSYCTPDFVMGTSMVDARNQKDWTAISSQNRWEGVIFAGHSTARIFTQPLQPQRGSVYNAEWSVQKRGVLIVQRLKTSNAKGQRVWFDASLKPVERDGWVFAEAPQAYAAVRVVNGEKSWEADAVEQHHERKGCTDGGQWLRCADEFSPVIIEVARKADCKDFAAFQAAILGNALKWGKHRLEYTSALSHTTLTLFADYSKPPLVDGVPVNYAPKKVYDSPFIKADFGSGVVTIRKGDRKLLLNFGE